MGGLRSLGRIMDDIYLNPQFLVMSCFFWKKAYRI